MIINIGIEPADAAVVLVGKSPASSAALFCTTTVNIINYGVE